MGRDLNDGHETLVNRMAPLEQDFLNTTGLLAGDAIVSGRRWLDMDERFGRRERNRRGTSQT